LMSSGVVALGAAGTEQVELTFGQRNLIAAMPLASL
jgi:hypothetical protein